MAETLPTVKPSASHRVLYDRSELRAVWRLLIFLDDDKEISIERARHRFPSFDSSLNDLSITGSRSTENWEMRIEGPNGFERSCSLASSSGEHEPEVIGNLFLKLLPPAMTQA